MKKSKIGSSAHYVELQKRCKNINQFRAAQNFQSLPVSIGAAPVSVAGNAGHGSDAKALTENAIEDFALAPILGLDRREVASSSFVYGTEDHFFHQALTILHSLQRLRRRRLLAATQSAELSAAAPEGVAPSTPRSSAFTWDLVDPTPDEAAFFENEDDRALPDIPEEQGGQAEGAPVTGDTLESLQAEFDEAVSSLEALGTGEAKQRAKRLRVRFSLIAHDVAATDGGDSEASAKGYLAELAKACKVKHNHKPPSVPGGGSVAEDAESGEAAGPAKSVSEADYSPELQLNEHVAKCLAEGRKQKREWAPSEERCAAFWRKLTMLGRAKLLALLVDRLGAIKASAAPGSSRPDLPKQRRAARRVPDTESSSGEVDSGSGADDDEGSESEPSPLKAAGSASAEAPTASFTAEELLAVLARGLEFAECPEKRDHVLQALKALCPLLGAKALISPAAKLWFPRLTPEERADVAREVPGVWGQPQYVAWELRIGALPPALSASAEELVQWADKVAAIWERAEVPSEEEERLLMSEMRVYSLHHALLARERAAWLEKSAAAAAPSKADAPVVHAVSSPMVVPPEALAAYVHAWRPPGSGGFVPEAPAGKKPQSRKSGVCRAAAEALWAAAGTPGPSLRAAVLPDEDAALAARLICAAVAAGGAAAVQGLKLDQQWLQRVMAEATLTSAGASASPSQADLQAYAKAKVNLVELTERIEVEFEPCNRELFGAGEHAEVLVRAKNCGTLAVRVFEVDAWRYYVTHGKEVPSDLSLEGLEPNAEVMLPELQQAPPLRRTFLRLRLPFVERGGVFVLELIGNGVSCRALLHVGALHLAEVKRDAEKQTFAVYDHAWQRLQSVSVLVDGSEYESSDGNVAVPHMTEQNASEKWTKAVVRSGSLCGLFDIMRYNAGQCELRGGVFVDEEQLLEGGTSVVAICRVQLFRNQELVPLAELKTAELQVWWKFDGADSFQLGERRDVTLSDEEDHVSRLEIPRGARGLELDLIATLPSGAEVRLGASTFAVHGVAEQCTTDDVHLCAGYELRALGRSGEPVAGRVMDVHITTALSNATLAPLKCRTDAEGRIPLGNLQGVVSVKASFSSKSPGGPTHISREWALAPRHHSWSADESQQSRTEPIVLCAPGGEATVPVHDSVVFVLEEVRSESGSVVQDLSHLATFLSGDALHFSGLPAGRLCRLRLWFSDGNSAQRLLLTASQLTSDGLFATVDGAALFEWRPEDVPPRIERSELADGGRSVRLKVAGAKPGARVHLVARRFWRALGLTAVGSKVPLRLPSRRFPAKAAESAFLRTRRVGDIIRYVLERRPLAAHPEFSAPSLPAQCTAPFPATCVHGTKLGESTWSVHGDAAGEVVEQRKQEAKERPPPSLYYRPHQPKSFAAANVAFVEPSEVIANVPLGADGRVEVKLGAASCSNHFFCEVLLVQPNAQAAVVLSRDPSSGDDTQPPRNRDMRLSSEVLDPMRHFGEVHGSRVLKPGEVFELCTPSVSKMQVYNCLPQVFDALLALLNRSPQLKHFEYLKRWPELDNEAKLAHYSRDACHELHLFLFAHDRPFFDGFVAPLIANRRRYSRLDRWLLRLPPEPETALGLLRASRLEQLLVAADVQDASVREAKLRSLLRLAEEDAAGEAASISLQRRTKAYDVMLQPHAAQLEPERKGKQKPGGPGKPRRAAWNRQSSEEEGEFDEEEGEYDMQVECMPMQAVRCAPARMMNRARVRAAAPVRRVASFDAFEATSCCSARSCSDPDMPPQLQQAQNLHAQLRPAPSYSGGEREAWFSKPAQRVTERAWLTPDGLAKGGAALWREVTRALLEQKPPARWPSGFVSAAALEACLNGSVSEAVVALALLSLPFVPAETPAATVLTSAEGLQVKRVGAGSGAAVVFFSMVQEVEAPTEASPLLLTQELRTMAGNTLPRSSELMVNSVITAQVLVVNCGAQPRELRLLLQCPEGAIPVGEGSFYTRSVDVDVPAFGSKTVENHFYFPRPGSFRWFPAHALAEEKLVAFETVSAPLKVVSERGAVDAASWRDVAARGSLDDVLAFLRRPRAEGGLPDTEELLAIAWRMKDAKAFQAIVGELRSQLRFSRPLWGYGFLHSDLEAVKEFLVMDAGFKGLVGPRMESGLLTTEAHDGSVYSHCDFEGLVLSRAHTVGVQRQNIEDSDLRTAYRQFLVELSYAAVPSLEDRVLLTNFMLMQDRVDEARVAFEPVKEVLTPRLAGAAPIAPGPLQLQAAYHMAYLDLVGGGELVDAKLALKAFGSAPWLTTAWRERFAALRRAVQAACPEWLAGSAGAEGAATASSAGGPAGETGGGEADGAALTIEEVDPQGHRIRLSGKSLRQGTCRLACYVVDVELTFSASPFAGSGSGEKGGDNASHVTAIAPTVAVALEGMPPEGEDWWVPLPESVRRRQMVLEVVAAAATRSGRRLSACRPCYFCDAEVSFDEKVGTLSIANAGKPAMGAYVKVFASSSGGAPRAPKFYKDGYTDCLGVFDYVSLNAKRSPLNEHSRLAVLVVTKESGALVRVLPAPPLTRSDLGPAEDTPGVAAPPPPPPAWFDGGTSSCGSSEQSGYGDEF